MRQHVKRTIKPITEGKLATSAPMAKMREIAFGNSAKVFLHQVELKMEQRDGDALVSAADARRLRRMERNKRNAQKD